MYRCRYLAHGLYISYDCFRHCHLSIHAPQERENNFITAYSGPKDKVDWDKIFELKQKLVREMRYEDKIPAFCRGCHWLEKIEEDAPEKFESDLDNYIDMVWLGHFNECNAKCIYCMSFEAIVKNQMIKDFGVVTLLEEMLDKKIYNLEKNPYSHISFAMGEPTLLKNFDKIIKVFAQAGNINFAIYTNAIKCSDMLIKLLPSEKVNIRIVVSLDSGSREVYKKVKLVDKFDDVCKNIKKYAIAAKKAKPNALGVKYIIIPKVNDTKEELDRFFDLCVNKLGVTYLIADIEEHWFVRNNGEVPEYLKDLLRHIRNKCQENNIAFEFFDRALVTKL